MKARILDNLTQTSSPISGERLSDALGVSRVAIWKHIRQLQDLGYSIEATAKGYRLLNSPDTPFPWVFGERAAHVHYYPEVASTMDTAMTLARGGCPEFTVVAADRQTKGRGRLQRVWQSAPGGLYFTMVVRPKINLSASPLINLAAAVDLADTVHALYGIPAQLKWPNDLLVQERKLAGILSQMAAEPDRIEFVNVGIGINVHNDTRNVVPPAVSVSEIAGAGVSRARILKSFWERFERRMAAGDLHNVVAQWKQRGLTLGRQVRVQTLTETWEGLAIDLDETGGLVLQFPNGQRKTIVYGDCFHDRV